MKKIFMYILLFSLFFSSVPAISVYAEDSNLENKETEETEEIIKTWNFEFTGDVEEFTAPYSGQYHLCLWGAAGGGFSDYMGGMGGYTAGYVNLRKGQTIYLQIGEAGKINGPKTWNGGGAGGNGTGAGGGATSATITNRGELKNFSSYQKEVLAVAGGGGGTGTNSIKHIFPNAIGNGGGLYGDISSVYAHVNPVPERHKPADQTSGYAFGQGEDYSSINNEGYGGAGGGGWYGGLNTQIGTGGGNGGSGYFDGLKNGTTLSGICKSNGKATITYNGLQEVPIKINFYNGFEDYDGTYQLNKKTDEILDLSQFKLKEGYDLIRWEINECDSELNENLLTVGFDDIEITAVFKAPLILETNIEDNKISASFTEKDLIEKEYRVYQSIDKNSWYFAKSSDETQQKNDYSNKFNYTGNVQTYTALQEGYYQIAAYGGSGGGSIAQGSYRNGGGLGGFSQGTIYLKRGQNIYIACGGAGQNGNLHGWAYGGWNGGGLGSNDGGGGGSARDDEASGGGGGATHFATTNRGTLSNYNNNRNEILLVAGGGGGSSYTYYGGQGGGLTGGISSNGYYQEISQNTGYAFGQGQNGSGVADSDGVGGGGGGWYGGYALNIATRSGGYGGSGYIGGVMSGYTKSGVNSGHGYATVGFVDYIIAGNNELNNIICPDTIAPDTPKNGKIESNDSKITITWEQSNDNGNDVFHKVQSFDKNTKEFLRESNITKDNYTSGLKGYYYYIDNNAAGVVTKDNTFTENEQIETTTSAATKYVHIAAVDNFGNLSDTYNMIIPSIAKYVVNHYTQNEDGSYTLVKAEEKMGQIGSTVTPDVISQTGRDNPPAKSIVITADGKAHVDYYYDVTRFDINGSVSWNDHENLYGTRPDNTGITIYRDGEYFDYITIPTIDMVNKYQFSALQKYDLNTGREFEYAVSQDVAYSQAALENSEDKYQTRQNAFDFLNTIRNVEPVSPDEPNPDNPNDKGLFVEGDIYWNDNEDSLGFRPSKTTITLYQKGEDGEWKIFGDPIVVDAKNDNHYIFDWLPKYWYDENDVPTAYEYKVEETFEAWYVKDDEIKNAYIIHEDQPNDFGFTNEFIPDGPIIPVNEYTNTLIVKTNTDEQVRTILKPLELFINNDYSVSYGDPTGNDIPVMTDKTGASVSDLLGTRYEIVLDSSEYTLEDIKLRLSENIELEQIGGKWYVTIKNVPADIIGTLEVELSPNKRFYQDRQGLMNYFTPGLKTITKEIQKYSVMKMSDSIVIYDQEMDKDATTSDSSELTDNLTITYMNSDTEDLNVYSVEDKAEISDYLGKIPAECKFIGWSETMDSNEAKYMAGDIIELEKDITLYPVFCKTIEERNFIKTKEL